LHQCTCSICIGIGLGHQAKYFLPSKILPTLCTHNNIKKNSFPKGLLTVELKIPNNLKILYISVTAVVLMPSGNKKQTERPSLHTTLTNLQNPRLINYTCFPPPSCPNYQILFDIHFNIHFVFIYSIENDKHYYFQSR